MPISRSEEVNIGLVQSELAIQTFFNGFFARFTGWVKQPKEKGEPEIPSNSPISINRKPAEAGMDFIIAPMIKKHSGKEFYGDTDISRKLESIGVVYKQIRINQRRMGCEDPSRMGHQRTKAINLIKQNRPHLNRTVAPVLEDHIMMSFYEGASKNITAAKSENGLGIAKKYHPNIYGAGAGEVTWSGTQATHISNIHDMNSEVEGGAVDNRMTVRALKEFRLFCIKKKIKPIVSKDGFEFRPILIDEYQAFQLMDDEEFQKAQQTAQVRSMTKNPLFNGMIGFIAGFAVYVRPDSVKGLSSTSTTLTFGSGTIDTIDSYPNRCAVTFGSNAIGGGWAFGPHFETEEYNHGNNSELSLSMIDGYSCNSYYDNSDDAAVPTEVINETSAILVTNSPSPI